MYCQISRKFENWTEGNDLEIRSFKIDGSSRAFAF